MTELCITPRCLPCCASPGKQASPLSLDISFCAGHCARQRSRAAGVVCASQGKAAPTALSRPTYPAYPFCRRAGGVMVWAFLEGAFLCSRAQPIIQEALACSRDRFQGSPQPPAIPPALITMNSGRADGPGA